MNKVVVSEETQKVKTPESKVVKVWCDGSALKNGKVGAKAGYGVYFGSDYDPRNVSKPLPGPVQTNQRAELMAILAALQIVFPENSEECLDVKLIIYTDSMYSINCVKTWYANWEKNGFITANKEPVKNLDLIKPIHDYYEQYGVEFVHVRGHQKSADINAVNNNKADKLARGEALL